MIPTIASVTFDDVTQSTCSFEWNMDDDVIERPHLYEQNFFFVVSVEDLRSGDVIKKFQLEEQEIKSGSIGLINIKKFLQLFLVLPKSSI